MRILLASYYYQPSRGGLERQSHLLARGLVQRGHRVHVISAQLAGFLRRESMDGVGVERVYPGNGSRFMRMSRYIAGMVGAAIRERSRTDVFQVQQSLYPAAAMALAARAMGRPLVIRNSGSGYFGGIREMQRLPAGRTSLRLMGSLATTVALSSTMADEMRSAGFRRVVRIPNGVAIPAPTTSETRRAARQLLGLQGRVAIYSGRLSDEKGIDTLIAAWQVVGGAPLGTLVIVGDGPAGDRLRGQAASDPFTAATVEFRGVVDDVQPYLAAADVFVLPSRSEGMSNSLLEAMAAGVPVIASDVGGNRDLVERHDLGWLVPPENPAALGMAIANVLDCPDDAARVGAAAREHVHQRYSVEAMLTAYEHLYGHLTDR